MLILVIVTAVWKVFLRVRRTVEANNRSQLYVTRHAGTHNTEVEDMTDWTITDIAVLIGWSPDGKCVYSAAIPLGQYWDGEHVWENLDDVKRLRLEKLRGLLFDSTATLIQALKATLTFVRSIHNWLENARDGTYQKL